MEKAIKLCSDEKGYRIYRHSLLLVFISAINKVLPDCRFTVHQSVNRSTYVEFSDHIITNEILDEVRNEMDNIVAGDKPLDTIMVSKKEAVKLYEDTGHKNHAKKIGFSPKDELVLYKAGNNYYSVYGDILPSAGQLNVFELSQFESGILIRYPHPSYGGKFPPFVTGKKIIRTIDEYRDWNEYIGISDVFQLNRHIAEGKTREIINIAEIMHEKTIAHISDKIKNDILNKKVILISGPSSSGKTTFANRLMLHLRVNGVKPIVISLDDYFLDNENAPVDENGKKNFEDLEALDYELFNLHLVELIEGKTVQVPRFDFHTGTRCEKTKPINLEPGNVVIVEGIHALNEKLTKGIPLKNLFKVYCSALTSMSFDMLNPISPTDTRLLRRIIRDHNFRNSTVMQTIGMWDSVVNGEVKNIFPYENNIDVIFNSSMVYEFAVYKDYAMPLLMAADCKSDENGRIKRLIELLSYFEPMSDKFVPPMSILREFIGNSSISY